MAELTNLPKLGEVGHWEILDTLNKSAARSEVATLVDWALPIQRRHLETVRSGSLELAADEDPNEPA